MQSFLHKHTVTQQLLESFGNVEKMEGKINKEGKTKQKKQIRDSKHVQQPSKNPFFSYQ